MSPCKALWVVVLSVCVRICNALPSVPVATDPIVTTTTISTVLPSLVTIYSVVPATDDPNAISTITTTIDGQQTIVTAPDGVIAGSSTSTIISTISLTTTQVVVSTIGYSTVFGPDPVAATTPAAVASETAPTSPVTTTTPPSIPLVVSTTPPIEVISTSSTSSVIIGDTSTTSTSFSAPTTIATGVSSSSSSSASSSSGSLSTGAKAGIGVGVAIGVLGLIAASFFLGLRCSRRRRSRNNAHALPGPHSDAEEKNTFQAGRPYEETRTDRYAIDPLAGKNGYSRATTEAGSESGVKSHDRSSPVAPAYHNNDDLSALPQFKNNDMYVGVPTYMSGSKRWSMREFEK
ncbi:hypothetical protein H2202_007125 [Exophiala xenobiotica]|nr:hypothetical protein H2202_007125 [Exophiala xenobiotica]